MGVDKEPGDDAAEEPGDAAADDDRPEGEQSDAQLLPALDHALDAIVLNETLIVSEDRNGTPASAAIRWSLLRSTTDRESLVRVTTEDAENANAAVVAADIRIELFGDDLYGRLTRGVEVVVHGYEVLTGPAEWLRQSAGQALVAEIAGHAITWPLR